MRYLIRLTLLGVAWAVVALFVMTSVFSLYRNGPIALFGIAVIGVVVFAAFSGFNLLANKLRGPQREDGLKRLPKVVGGIIAVLILIFVGVLVSQGR